MVFTITHRVHFLLFSFYTKNFSSKFIKKNMIMCRLLVPKYTICVDIIQFSRKHVLSNNFIFKFLLCYYGSIHVIIFSNLYKKKKLQKMHFLLYQHMAYFQAQVFYKNITYLRMQVWNFNKAHQWRRGRLF